MSVMSCNCIDNLLRNPQATILWHEQKRKPYFKKLQEMVLRAGQLLLSNPERNPDCIEGRELKVTKALVISQQMPGCAFQTSPQSSDHFPFCICGKVSGLKK